MRLTGLYPVSGMGRREFCRRHDMALRILNRHLKRQQMQYRTTNDGGVRSPLVEVELSASVVPTTSGEQVR